MFGKIWAVDQVTVHSLYQLLGEGLFVSSSPFFQGRVEEVRERMNDWHRTRSIILGKKLMVRNASIASVIFSVDHASYDSISSSLIHMIGKILS